jgi:hypothetical protein
VGLLCISLSLGLSACQKSDPLIGAWRDEKGRTIITFRADRTFVVTEESTGGSRDYYGTYLRDAQRVILTRHNETRPLTAFDVVTLGENEMNLRMHERGSLERFSRVSTSPMPPSAAEQAARTPLGAAELKRREAEDMARSVDKAVLNNARQLAAAADQYYLENGVTSVARADLIGPTAYIRALNTVSGESYPTHFAQGVTITITGIAGARTITYAP